MGEAKKKVDRIIILRGTNIGAIAAENDKDFLYDCFVHLDMFSDVVDLENSKNIILGRTGSGKTAILQYIRETNERVYELDPEEVSLEYVSNSRIIKELEDLGVDLSLFYQLLWKHVICAEAIRKRFDIHSTSDETNFFTKISDFFRKDERRRKAVEYLRSWDGKLWQTLDERIKAVTESFEHQVVGKLSGDLPYLKTEGSGQLQKKSENKTELKIKAQTIVNSIQIASLNELISSLAEYGFGDNHKQYYLVIDGLDNKWVDERIRFRMIRALIDALKTFRRVRNLKILIALRTDVLEKVLTDTKEVGTQREKYDDVTTELRWNTKELKVLVDERMKLLFKRKYTKQNVLFDDVFEYNVGNKKAFDYMAERTLLRPRDIIAFTNQCLQQAVNDTSIKMHHIKDAELEYSRKRREAIEEEWISIYPAVNKYISVLTRSFEVRLFQDLEQSENISLLALDIASEDKYLHDPLYKLASKFTDDSSPRNRHLFARDLTSALYRMGLVGVRLHVGEPYRYCYLHEPILDSSLIDDSSRIIVHPMFHRALTIQQNQSEETQRKQQRKSKRR